jgi:hypothetical protein
MECHLLVVWLLSWIEVFMCLVLFYAILGIQAQWVSTRIIFDNIVS